VSTSRPLCATGASGLSQAVVIPGLGNLTIRGVLPWNAQRGPPHYKNEYIMNAQLDMPADDIPLDM
jgi:hypothetical protein